MKKVFATLLAGLLSLSAAFGLVACGDDDDGGKNTGDNGQVAPGGSGEQPGGSGEQPGGSGEQPGGSEEQPEPETPDVQAPAYADGEWEASLNINSLIEGEKGSVSPDLFGLFLEDINYAAFALDDNLIVNGSFETLTSDKTTGGKEYGWTEQNATITVGRNADVALYPATNPNYATVNAQAGGAISNSGHEKVPVFVTRGKDYTFSMFIKNYAGDVTVSVKDSQNAVFAEGTFTVAENTEWVKYVKTVSATKTAAEGLRVEISFGSADSAFQIDAVKFETSDATEFGMRNYMYKAIEELGPKFFRFPGGCVIEGTNINEAYDWKNSIGVKTGETAEDDELIQFTYPVNDNGNVSEITTYGEQAVRKENTNIWQGADGKTTDYYDHEYGIGFYEYFCLCDSLGAKAIPIVSCGMSCQTQSKGTALAGRHEQGVADYIQDAIDLIEFAKGATSTKWGKIREQLGHPEPFEMDYIGIGNEQWGNYYTEYYEAFLKDANFQKALAQYSVKPIVGNCTLFEHCQNSDGKNKTQGAAQAAAVSAKSRKVVNTVADYGVHDQHYYVNYTDFFLNTKMYDSYARPDTDPDTYYEVFVGEYAANSREIRSPSANNNVSYDQLQNSWITALSEAAMMTGFERNGDIVKLAAYAPMFAVADQAEGATEAGSFADNQWIGANMMYFTNRSVVRTPNYFVQQLFMKNSGTRKLAAALKFPEGSEMPTVTVRQTGGSATRTYDTLYFVADKDEATGDLIVKLVNAGNEEIKFNVNIKMAGVGLTGIAKVTELANSSPRAVSTYFDGEAIAPETQTIGFTGNAFGVALKAYSVTAIRIRTA